MCILAWPSDMRSRQTASTHARPTDCGMPSVQARSRAGDLALVFNLLYERFV
jgi:hypothetical protein